MVTINMVYWRNPVTKEWEEDHDMYPDNGQNKHFSVEEAIEVAKNIKDYI